MKVIISTLVFLLLATTALAGNGSGVSRSQPDRVRSSDK